MKRNQTQATTPPLAAAAAGGEPPSAGIGTGRPGAAAILRRALLVLPLWWVISEGQWQALPVGLVAVVAALSLSLFLLPRVRYVPRLPGLFVFIGWFLLHSARAGVVVAGTIVFSRPRLEPELVRLRVRVPPGGPRWLLADVIGMMPGTLCVALNDDQLTLHCLNGAAGIHEEVDSLERQIARLLGLRLEALA